MKQVRVVLQFVEFIPERLENGVLYISQKYKTAAHKCCCGCGEEVITPLNPTDWKLTVDGKLGTLYPSIGNWGFACRSHYWIRKGLVVWAPPMPQWQIERGRLSDRANKAAHFRKINAQKERSTPADSYPNDPQSQTQSNGLFARLLRSLSNRTK